ncbi:MAG: Crp/Fnr family transcriptional regulator [Alphaproteobacteria bacterium]|nr:MAG: Crp/Fnr family transcriptional regulator [Alphaproteobacteria bacterium]
MSVAPSIGAPPIVSASLDRSLIKNLPLFAGMAEVDLDDVLIGASSRRYVAGTSVFEQGKVAEQFFVLLHGRLRVTHLTPQGQQTVVRMVSPGDLFGIAKALRRPDYPGTATAVVDSIALAWAMDRWDQLLPRHPSLAINAMQTMGQRLQEAQTLVRELSNEEVERRVAHAVLRLASQSGLKEAAGIRIDFPVSKQDIAEMTGTTLHTVSRILTAWEHAGLVEGGRQKLLVKESHRLMMIADGAAPGLL